MKIQDILELEKNNTNNIILHKEGIFWRAYEKSAYLFTLYIKEYQITKKFYKNVNTEVVYLGFPKIALEQILELAKDKEIQKKETQIFIKKYEFTNDDFLKWKTNLADLAYPQDLNLSEKIKNFPVATKEALQNL
ncbi:MAG: hypothetical protein U9Q83_09375 [Bacteroidota bacterium]|nr:hypothetical protein [Bacteroidota bacterium]